MFFKLLTLNFMQGIKGAAGLEGSPCGMLHFISIPPTNFLIERGIAGSGEYTIASEHKTIEVQGLENVAYLMALSPEDIVKNIRTAVLMTHMLEKQKKRKLIPILEVRI